MTAATLVVFGSARALPEEEAEALLAEWELRRKESPDDGEVERSWRRARKQRELAGYYGAARRFAALATEHNLRHPEREMAVVTGGGPGLMEAANRGASDVGGRSLGLNIILPMEQQPNPYITPELCFQFHYFAIRKMHFLLRAKAMVAFPGGFGTMDELFETLTLVQTKVMDPIPIILFGKDYWQRVIDFPYLLSEGVIDARDLDLFRYADRAEEAWEVIRTFHAIHPTVTSRSPLHRA